MNLSFFVHADNDFAGRASTRFGLSFVPPPTTPEGLVKINNSGVTPCTSSYRTTVRTRVV